jgi:DNA-binding IclR family transcriptional regulator
MRHKSSSSEENLLHSVQNALRIVQMLQDEPSIKAAAIGEELGLGRSTVHRLLATLEHEGFLRRDRVQSGYRAGRVLIAIGLTAVGDIDVRKKARSYMEALAAECGETVHLFVLEGPNTRIIDGVEGSYSVRAATDVGVLLPAHATAGGKALLAAMPNAQIRSRFPRGLPKVTASTTTNWESFELELDLTRRRGYAINRGEADESTCGVAVPIVDRGRRLVASLALSIPRDRLTEERIPTLAGELRRQAQRIGETLV